MIGGPDRIGWPTPRSVASRFSRYDLADHLAVAAPDCAAWLTGQSSYRHSQLSVDQLGLLDLLAGAGYATVRGGFPFNGGALALPYRPEPLAAACARNIAQYLAAGADGRFRTELGRHLQPLLDRTGRRLVLLCGSCGLELLAAAVPRLSLPPQLEVLVVALGPVGRLPADNGRLRLHVIRAKGDWISRLGCHREPDLRVPGGHLGYPRHHAVRAEVVRVAAAFRR